MIQVKIGNSISKVSGLTAEQFKQVRELMCYRVPTRIRVTVRRKVKINGKTGIKSGTVFQTRKCYLIDQKGEFPTGLLYILQDYLQKSGTVSETIDTRIKPKLKQLGLDTLFVDKSMDPRMEQLEASISAKTNERGIIVAPTGFGKSFVVALIVDVLQVPTLIVVPTLNLKTQITESLREMFGEDKVGPLHKGKRKFFITVENVDALSKKPMEGFDAVIIDEFHHSGAATYRDLNKKAWNSIYYKFGLTATPFRSKNEERLLLESVLSKVIYQVPYDTAVGKGYIVPMEVYYIDLPKIELKGSGENYHAVYCELITKRQDRNELIAHMASKLHAAGISYLVLTKQIDHGVKIQDLLAEQGYFVPFAEGKNLNNKEILKRFNAAKEPGLIGTVGVLGEGVDTKPAEYVIIAGGGKSKNQFMQNLGRGFRNFDHPESGPKKSCKIIMFRDPSHKWMIKHFKECCKHLKEEYGIVPTKLDISASKK